MNLRWIARHFQKSVASAEAFALQLVGDFEHRPAFGNLHGVDDKYGRRQSSRTPRASLSGGRKNIRRPAADARRCQRPKSSNATRLPITPSCAKFRRHPSAKCRAGFPRKLDRALSCPIRLADLMIKPAGAEPPMAAIIRSRSRPRRRMRGYFSPLRMLGVFVDARARDIRAAELPRRDRQSRSAAAFFAFRRARDFRHRPVRLPAR